MKLLYTPNSPYARKVRIQLAEKQIPFELITEVPWNSETTTPQFNPLEKVPVLLLPDGGSVFESRYIGEWIEAKHPERPLMPNDVDERLAVKRFEVLADGACDALVLMFFENAREPEHRSEPWFARQRRKLDGALQAFAHEIGEREFCVGKRLTMDDIAVGSMLRYLTVRWPQDDWRLRFPELARYSVRLENRDSFAATQPVPQVIRDRVA